MARHNTERVSALDTDTANSAGQVARQFLTSASLGGLVEGEIIPRLLMAHRDDCLRAALCLPDKAAPGCAIDCGEAARFAVLPLRLEADELLAEVETFLERGVPVRTILVDLLAPSARRLGELWEDDACDFVDVTMGLWRLQEVMRIVALRSPPVIRAVESTPTALFAPMPGDQHSFGALMVEEIFARAGWQSEVLFEPKRQDVLAIVGQRAFDLVGLTVTNDCPSGVIADLVSAVRTVSRNPAVRLFVGGRAINANPDLASRVGADGTASDASSALALAERMIADAKPLVGHT